MPIGLPGFWLSNIESYSSILMLISFQWFHTLFTFDVILWSMVLDIVWVYFLIHPKIVMLFLYRFVKVESLKEKLLENNKQTYWVPDFVKVTVFRFITIYSPWLFTYLLILFLLFPIFLPVQCYYYNLRMWKIFLIRSLFLYLL